MFCVRRECINSMETVVPRLLKLFIPSGLSHIGVASMVVVCLAASASADQKIKDPKIWADSIVSLIADRQVDKVIDEVVNSSGGLVTREKIQVAMGSVIPIVAQAGSIRTTDLLAERRYGRSFAVFWYYLLFEKQELYIRLRLVKRGDYWQLQNFKFKSDIDALGLPN